MATICLASSCGGHFMELIQLLPAVEKYDFYIITEKNIASKSILCDTVEVVRFVGGG